jgi:hypothetical protein
MAIFWLPDVRPEKIKPMKLGLETWISENHSAD